MEIRRYKPGDESEVAALIQRSLVEKNPEDPPSEREWLMNRYTPEYIKELAEKSHTYVICENGKPVGTGTILVNDDVKNIKQSEIVACFLNPDYIGTGLGRKLFDVLEADEYFTSAERVWLTSSIMAQGFYDHLGYVNPNGHGMRNADTLIEYEKIRKPKRDQI